MEKNDSLVAVFSCLGMATFVVLIIVLGAAVEGVTLSILWNWFMVPIFELPRLALWQAYGIALVVASMKSQDYKETHETADEKKKSAVTTLVMLFVRPALLLLVGLIVRSLI